MTIHFNTPPVHSGICAKRTNLAELRVLFAALVAAMTGLHSGLSQAAESAGPPAMAPMAAPPAGAYKLDKSHASLVLRANHMGFSTYTTRFSRLDADLTLDARNLSASRVVTTIDASSFEMDANLLPDEEARKSHEDGWKGFLNNLQLFLGDLEWAT